MIMKILTVVTLVQLALGDSCPSLCSCKNGLTECRNQNLYNVQAISTDTTILDLTGNLFNGLDVSFLKQLDTLIMDMNKNLEKSQNGLALPSNLRKLSLANCRLTRLLEITRGKSQIQVLNLSNNRLKRIEQFEFAGWNKLEELDLSNNEIVIKQSGNGNFFRDVPKSIKKLILDDNQIQMLQWGSMDDLKHLEHLSLRRNNLQHLPKLPSSAELRYIDLSANHIDKIETFTFKGLPKLQSLNLAQNKLRDGQDSLPAGALYVEKTSLVSLNISHNMINRLEYSLLWQHEKLEVLDLSHNSISSMDVAGKMNKNHNGNVHSDSTWKDTKQLAYLDMSFNNLTRCESNGFRSLDKLKVLKLNNNFIKLLEENAFYGLKSVEEIYLESNNLTDQIEDISGGFDSLKTLEKLDLRHNKIGRISRSVFSSLERLQWLDLVGNPIAEVEPQSFVDDSNHWKKLSIDSASLLCDCNLAWFTEFFQKLADNDKTSPRCRHPMMETEILDLDPAKLKCDENPRPVIISHPKSRSVQDGHEAKFECKAKTAEIERTEIEWQIWREADSKWTTLSSERGLYEIKHSRPPSGTLVESILTLPTVAQEASGNYRCRVINSYARKISEEAKLVVHKLPKFTNQSKNKTVALGDRVKLACQAIGHPEPEIQWVHSGTLDMGVSTQDLTQKLELPKNYQATMRINRVDVEDSGKYTCIAKNSAGFVSYDMFISMAPVPEKIEYEPTMNSVKGRNAVLDCAYPIQIYPEVSVTWYYQDREINSTSLRHFLTVNKSQTHIHHLLIINEASEEDDGLYQCRVHNAVGSATGSIDLQVSDNVEIAADSDIPVWIWVLTTVVSTFLISSIIWLAVFCRALVQRKKRNGSAQGASDLGTDETNIPSPMERLLADNKKYGPYHQKQGNDSRMDECLMKATPVSSIETDTQTESNSTPLPPQQPFQPFPVYSPYLSYNPFPMHMVSPYLHPYYQMSASLSGLAHPYQSPFAPAPVPPPTQPQTNKNHQTRPKPGFGPETKAPDLPYAPPNLPVNGQVPVNRAFTLPELDGLTPRRATFGGAPMFATPQTGGALFHCQDAASDAPGPARRKNRHQRRSEGLNRRLLFDAKETQCTTNEGAKIADDDGIVNRVLGPVETTD